MKVGNIKRTALMGALAILGSGVGASVLSIAGASAATNATQASVEVCKASVTGALAVTGPFSFTVSNPVSEANSTVTVNAGSCSAPIPVVTAAQTTITEATAPWFAATAITAPPGANDIASSSLTPTPTAVLNLQSSQTSTVTFTNEVVTGYIEVCKYPAATSGLTGTFGFSVTSDLPAANDPAGHWNSSPMVSVGSCSLPIQVPAGTAKIAEAGTNLYVTSISAYSTTNPTGSAINGTPNLVSGTTTVNVAASANPSVQTIVNYTDNVVQFKVCKDFDTANGPDPVTSYPFTVTASGAAGPNTAPGAISVLAGQCSPVWTFRAGTVVSVTEGVVPGTKVESIVDADATLDNAETLVPNSLSLANGTVSYILGTPVTAGQSIPGNEVAATYTDTDAAPGQLKICKLSGSTTLPPIGNSFTFNYSGTAYATVASASGVTPVVTVGEIVPVSGTVVVPLGGCVVIGENPVVNGVPTPVPFLYNSNVSIAEVASTGNAVSAIQSAGAQNVSVDDPSLTFTNEPVLSGVSLTGGTSTATISESILTEVDYFNVDPPVGVTLPTPVTTIGNGDGIVVTTPVVTNSSTSSNTVVSTQSSTSSVAPISVPVIVKPLTAAQKASLLKSYNKSLTNVKAAIVRENKLIKTATGKARTADMKRLSVLKAEQNILNKEIKALK
jgi:hypothetical protein